MKRLILFLILAVCFAGCSRSYTGYTYRTTPTKVVMKKHKFKNYTKCQRKSKKLAKYRAKMRGRNPNYGINVR